MDSLLFLIIICLISDIRDRPWLLVFPFAIALIGYVAAAQQPFPLSTWQHGKVGLPADIVAILGLSILIMCEVFYLVDNMGDTYYRMNTLLQIYIAAWLMMELSSPRCSHACSTG